MSKDNRTIQRMNNFDDITKGNIKNSIQTDHKFWPSIRILIVQVSGFGKTNALLNLINHQPDIDKIYSYAGDPYEAKYQLPNYQVRKLANVKVQV